jgi:hypothetical protein
MAQEVQVGTILISGWPQVFELENEPYSGRWNVVKGPDGFGVDRKIRILGEVNEQHFNGLEVTRIVSKRFLGLPYVSVSAHPRHVQQNCYLDGAEARRLSRSGQNCILPSRILHQSSPDEGAALSPGTD